jgi:hypothetical protein
LLIITHISIVYRLHISSHKATITLPIIDTLCNSQKCSSHCICKTCKQKRQIPTRTLETLHCAQSFTHTLHYWLFFSLSSPTLFILFEQLLF